MFYGKRNLKTHTYTPAKRVNNSPTCDRSTCHFASVPLPLVEHVSAVSSSFNLRKSFSSPLTASTNSRSSPDSIARSFDVHADLPDRGACAGPPGCRIAPTAVDREILFGRTRKLFAPGMIRRPYRSPRLREREIVLGTQRGKGIPVEDVILSFGSLPSSPLTISRFLRGITRPKSPHDRSLALFNERIWGSLGELKGRNQMRMIQREKELT